MALASLDDVKRILRFTNDDDVRDAQLQAALDAVESVMEPKLKGIGRSGSLSADFFDVREDATLHLNDPSAVVTLVEVFEAPSVSGVPLSPISLGVGEGYDVTDEGGVLLRPVLTFQPFEGALASRLVGYYSRVTVHYQGSGQVPAAVTEGVAYLAAGYWKDGPRALSGIKREKIGKYEYELQNASTNDDPSYVPRAMWFLDDYLAKQRVTVV